MNEEFPFAFLIGLKPEEAIAYLKAKKYKFTWDWHEMLDEAHNTAFTVAKVMKQDILEDIKLALQDAQEKGLTLQQFRRQLEPVLKSKGWWGRVAPEQVPSDTPLSPESQLSPDTVQLGSPYRLRTIYNTNIRSALMSGKYKRFIANAENRPYVQYIAILDRKTRDEHVLLNGLVFHFKDPILKIIWPPNDWGCRCNMRTLTAEQVKAKGLKITKGSTIKFKPGVGFRHNPGIIPVSQVLNKTVKSFMSRWLSGVEARWQ